MVLSVDWADVDGHVTSVDSYCESTGIDLTQAPDATRQLVDCLGNHPSCNAIGCLGNHPSCIAKPDFCHSSVALDHYNHVTTEECRNWILVEQGNHAWDNSAEDLSMTERVAHSWLECGDEKDRLLEN